ncbi:MAG: hypothetical protein L6V95_08990 [Candidatus Melainabacteria bacterium]|nr:MAG: hypothetical protein L6V95_08990 [Candidatus Melainabacteria bacterium]
MVNTNKLFIEKINELKGVENQTKDNKLDKDKEATKNKRHKLNLIRNIKGAFLFFGRKKTYRP